MNRTNEFPDVVFLGQPNSGKSALFNAIAGLKAQTSNFPGTTVTHTHSRLNFEGRILNIIDLPGTYSLNPSDEGEKVALTHLFTEKPDLIVNVVDASILGRSLELTIELIELGYPLVLALNMMDLAEKKGIEIDPQKLEDRLGIPVVPTIAIHGRGIKELMEASLQVLDKKKTPPQMRWAKDVEDSLVALQKKIPRDFPVVANRRFTAIKMIETERLFFHEMLNTINPAMKSALDSVKNDIQERHNVPAYEVVAAERHHLALKIFEECCHVKRGAALSFLDRLDEIIMHPLLGYFILLLVFIGFFFLIFMVGNPLEELILNPLNSLRQFLSASLGAGLLFYLADGLVQGIGGGLAIVLPYFVPLLILMSLLEDVGYLPRAAFLMDIFMHRIGLHGKSVSPLILGFGCNVPAIVSTRVLESKRDRIITGLLIPFIPCSARTTIILALVAFYLGPIWAFGFYAANILLVGIISRVISLFYKTPSPGLILEIPSLKLPSIKNVFSKTFYQLKSFVKFAWPILIAGSVVLAVLQYFQFDRTLNFVLAPLIEKALGLPRELGVTLIFGFLRKELSLVMMLQALGVGYKDVLLVMSKSQLIIFTTFISFFVPCISTVAILWKEIGKNIALLSVGLNISVAIVLSLLVRLIIGF